MSNRNLTLRNNKKKASLPPTGLWCEMLRCFPLGAKDDLPLDPLSQLLWEGVLDQSMASEGVPKIEYQ